MSDSSTDSSETPKADRHCDRARQRCSKSRCIYVRSTVFLTARHRCAARCHQPRLTLPHQQPEGPVVALPVAQRHVQAKPQRCARHQGRPVCCPHSHRRHAACQLAFDVQQRIGRNVARADRQADPGRRHPGPEVEREVQPRVWVEVAPRRLRASRFPEGFGVRTMLMAFSGSRCAPRARG